MARLRKEVRLFIVRSLAVFNTPTETAKAVQEEFKITVTRQQCEGYDPTKRTGQDLSAELREEFEITRQNFIDNPKRIPIANLTYRLERMQRIVENAGKNNMLVLTTLEQAAKEVGGMYTNTRIEKVPEPEDAPKPDYTMQLKPDEDVPSEPVL